MRDDSLGSSVVAEGVGNGHMGTIDVGFQAVRVSAFFFFRGCVVFRYFLLTCN